MEKEEKLDLDDLINDYRVENVDAFRTYLTGVWKDLAERSDNKLLFIKFYYSINKKILSRLISSTDDKSFIYFIAY